MPAFRQGAIVGFNLVRLDLEERIGRSSELSIASHGKRLVFATFLTDLEREDFAQALARALSANKAPSPA
jgi:uncharacterized membrane protein